MNFSESILLLGFFFAALSALGFLFIFCRDPFRLRFRGSRACTDAPLPLLLIRITAAVVMVVACRCCGGIAVEFAAVPKILCVSVVKPWVLMKS